MHERFIQLLRCPDDHSSLLEAESELTSRLNLAIREAKLTNRAGRLVSKCLDGGFIRAAGDLLYPIVDQIPVLIIDEAIPLDQLADPSAKNAALNAQDQE